MSAEQYFQNGRYKLELIPDEMRMSHWINAPVLTETQSGKIILDLSGDIWDLRSAQESNASILFSLARYPDGGKEYEVELIPQESKAIILGAIYPIETVFEVLKTLV